MHYGLRWIQATGDALPMRLMLKMRIWLGAPLIGIVVVVGGCSGTFVETTTNRYSNYYDAVADGALQRGWLPRNLPDSVHDIVETHNIDTNELWVKFQFDKADIKGLLRQCEKMVDLRLPAATRVKRMAAWWPQTLTDKNGKQLPNEMQAYSCLKMPHAESAFDAGMILDTQKQTAWYWIDP